MRVDFRSFYFIEAIKTTAFCLLFINIFWFLGASNKILLILVYMIFISAISTFSGKPTGFYELSYGSIMSISSLLIGGVMGYYYPDFAKFIYIFYTICAFLIPKTKYSSQVSISSVAAFIIFSAIPFNLSTMLNYAFYGGIIIVAFPSYHWIVNKLIYKNNFYLIKYANVNFRKKRALTAGIAMSLAVIMFYLLNKYFHISHLYWIPLTVLFVIQATHQQTIKASLLRICVNILGAVVVIIMMTYIIPPIFWVNFILLTTILFLFFTFFYSPFLRTLLIEIFVLSFFHLLGKYHNLVAFERLAFTLIGGCIVIISSSIVRIIYHLSNFSKCGFKKNN